MSRTFYGGASVDEASRVNGYVSFNVPSVAEQGVTAEEVTDYEDAVYAETSRTRRRTVLGLAAAAGLGVAIALGNIGNPDQPKNPVPVIYPQIAYEDGKIPPMPVPQNVSPTGIPMPFGR